MARPGLFGLSRGESIGLAVGLASLIVGIIAIPQEFWRSTWGLIEDGGGFIATHIRIKSHIDIPPIEQSGTELTELNIVVRSTTENEGQANQLCARPGACFYVVKVRRHARITGLKVDDIVVAVRRRADCIPDAAASPPPVARARESLKILLEFTRGYTRNACAEVIRSDRLVVQPIGQSQ